PPRPAAWLTQTRILQLRPELPAAAVEFDRGKLHPHNAVVLRPLAPLQPGDAAADQGSLRYHYPALHLRVPAHHTLQRVADGRAAGLDRRLKLHLYAKTSRQQDRLELRRRRGLHHGRLAKGD